MEAIELRRIAKSWSCPAAFLSLFLLPGQLLADRATDIRSQLVYVATALTGGNATDAMSPFDKSYADYGQLSDYFKGLSAVQIVSELEITDEEDSEIDTKIAVTWTLTLSDPNTNLSERRTADLNVRLVLNKGKWKIVQFSPIEIFNPLPKSATKR